MKIFYPTMLTAAAIGLISCSSSQDRAYKVQKQVHEERLELVDEYKKCIEKAGDDKPKVESCDSYLKAAEALK
jgi:cell division protein FtsL